MNEKEAGMANQKILFRIGSRCLIVKTNQVWDRSKRIRHRRCHHNCKAVESFVLQRNFILHILTYLFLAKCNQSLSPVESGFALVEYNNNYNDYCRELGWKVGSEQCDQIGRFLKNLFLALPHNWSFYHPTSHEQVKEVLYCCYFTLWPVLLPSPIFIQNWKGDQVSHKSCPNVSHKSCPNVRCLSGLLLKRITF